MKKLLSIALVATMSTMSLSGLLSACGPESSEKPPEEPAKQVFLTDRASVEFAYGGVFEEGLADEKNGIASAEDVSKVRVLRNGAFADSFTSFTSRQDVKLELYGERATRFVNVSAGYAFTLPATQFEADYSRAAYRSQFAFGDALLTVSLDSGNPYTAESDGWYTYISEWVFKYFYAELFEVLGITYTRTPDFTFTEAQPHGNLTVKPGYDVYRYDLCITDESGNWEQPYYHIALVRSTDSVKEHALFVMKGKTDHADDMDKIVQSYRRMTSKGIPRNYFDAGKPMENPRWNAETKAFYEDFVSSDSVRWGAFSMSMPGYRNEYLPEDGNYTYVLDLSRRYQAAIEEAWGKTYDIYPTYTALSYAGEKVRFPIHMAKELAGGNGFDGKPVLQFTYQFTGNNNLMGETPMFDIVRGVYDEQLHELARDIKDYRKPVLFRLNNEMNSDWTSYCGLITLLDPDIFTITWRHLYEIFEEEGVDNAIWIWNPIAESCPFSNWGEDLCYFPGREYVQLIGGTNYELNNYAAEDSPSKCKSFEELYGGLYEKNSAFREWAVILSEFGCGSGGDYSGELGRNRDVQRRWVEDMFKAFAAREKDYIKQIKGAIWFNANDYYTEKVVTNRYQIVDPRNNDYADLAAVLEAFRAGFAAVGR